MASAATLAYVAGVTTTATPARGRFITFEGGEGAGKSTQARRLSDRLRAEGLGVTLTREPGGSPGGEAIRELLVSGDTDRWSGTTETLLFYAARSDHLERTVRPALARGDWVVCDRFADSTRAYQGAAGGAAPSLLHALDREVVGQGGPDLTLLLDLPVEAGLARVSARGEAHTRFERHVEAFHMRLRQAFLEMAEAAPERWAVIDAADAEDAVAEAVWATVRERLNP